MPIPEFTRYLISKDGQIYSTLLKIILKQISTKDGYYNIGLVSDIGKKKSSLGVHVLVARAYIDNPQNSPEVNHIDGDKTNNSVENLEWCTSSENILHALDTGLNKTRREVVKYTFYGQFVEEYKSVKEAAKINDVEISTIIRSCKRKKSTHTSDRFFYKGEEEFDLYFKEWKPLPKYDSHLISRDGRIYSKTRDNLVKQTVGVTGKYSIGLPSGSCEVHRLVAEVYIPNPQDFTYVTHKNKDKLDNNVENLQWSKTIKIPTKSHPFAGKRAVIRIGEGEQRRYSSIREAAEDMNVNSSSIIRVCQQPGRTCRGYEWKYVEE